MNTKDSNTSVQALVLYTNRLGLHRRDFLSDNSGVKRVSLVAGELLVLV